MYHRATEFGEVNLTRNRGLRCMMRASLHSLLCVAFLTCVSNCTAEAQAPSFVVIIIDDLNDWIGCLEEHPQTKTPNIDRLARRGLLFRNAHVQATFCGPSRVSLLSGRMPKSTGCYDFEPYESLSQLTNHAPFPLHFRRNGYKTYGGGKIFHHGTGGGWVAESWDFTFDVPLNPTPRHSIHWNKKVWDWGAFPESNSQMGDYQLALEAAKTLSNSQSSPFLMVLGFRRPHVPLHVPKQWFDLHPLADVQVASAPAADLEDVPHPEIGLTPHAAPKHSELLEKDLVKSLTQAYLASISFVDHCVGQVLQGLEEGPNHNNTFVILLSDHGFHLGEKQHWAKRTLWEETTRIPLIVAGPGVSPNQSTDEPVGLIDLYPTLCDLAKTTHPVGLEGDSLHELLIGESPQPRRPAITTLGPNQYSVRSSKWRYIRYADGSEELYDHETDPHEWINLAAQPTAQHKKVIAEHRRWLPVLPRTPRKS